MMYFKQHNEALASPLGLGIGGYTENSPLDLNIFPKGLTFNKKLSYFLAQSPN